MANYIIISYNEKKERDSSLKSQEEEEEMKK